MEFGGAYDRQWARGYDDCIRWFMHRGMNPFPNPHSHSLWCNATWDGILCWPAIPAATKYTLQCPEQEAFDTSKNVTKRCHLSGRWLGEESGGYSRHYGFTDYSTCYRDQYISEPLDVPRVLNYVGLVLSIVAITITWILLVLKRSRRWRLNQTRMGLLDSMLFLYIIFLSLHIDEDFYESNGSGVIYANDNACRVFKFILEFSRFMANSWLLAVCFHGLFETVQESMAERCLWIVVYIAFSFMYAIACSTAWMCLMIFIQPSQSQFVCFGQYIWHSPSNLVLAYGNICPIALASLCSISHAVYALCQQFVSKTSRFSGVRWILQSVTHVLICICMAGLWYYDIWLDISNRPAKDGEESHQLSSSQEVIRAAVVSFCGLVVAILIGLTQLCLPAKERMRF